MFKQKKMNFLKKILGIEKIEEVFELPKPINEMDSVGVRDSVIKSKVFFQKQIQRKENNIERQKKRYKDKIETTPNFDFYLYFSSFNEFIMDLINSKYSAGYPISDIIPDCTPLMETTSRLWMNELDYSDGGDTNFISLINSICLGILGDVDKKYFKELSEKMQEKKFSDLYIDLLVNAIIPEHPIGEKLIVEDDREFKTFSRILKHENKKQNEQIIADFLTKYFYTRKNLTFYYNKHEFEGARNYYGYWCWQAAAIVKIKNLDDSLFKDNPYYPYDFVHHKD